MSEWCYIARFVRNDGTRSMATLLDVSPNTIAIMYHKMKSAGVLDEYKFLWDEVYANRKPKGE